MIQRLPVWAALAAALLLGACSATKLAYNNLDWLASWKVDDFVDLDGPAQDLFDERFAVAWKWHRKSQLPLYAADLRELAQILEQARSADEFDSYLSRAEAHVQTIVDKVLPDWAAVLAALDDRQVTGMLKALAEYREERAKELSEITVKELRQERLDRMHKGMGRWLGSRTPEQDQRVVAWADALLYKPELQLAFNTASGARFDALLKDRSRDDFLDRLRELMQDPKRVNKDIAELRAHNQAQGVELFGDLSKILTPKQRKHLRKELLELAEDLEILALKAVD